MLQLRDKERLRDERGRFIATPVPAWLDHFESAVEAPGRDVKVQLIERSIRNRYYLIWTLATLVGMSGMLLIGIYQF